MNAWLYDVASQRRLELATRPDGRLLAKAAAGSGTHRIAVISVPKAGTYMLARFLTHVGYVDSEWHLAEFLLTDYRGLSTEQKRGAAFRERVFQVPIGVSAGLVADGQFTVGHLPCTPYVRSSLEGFRKIFMYRNLVDAIFSRLRFRIDSGREPRSTPWVTMPPGPEQALAYLADVGRQRLHAGLAPLLGWIDEPGVVSIAYERLVGDQGEHEREACIARLAEAAGIPLELATSVFTTQVLGHPTPTLSGRRTEAVVYLDERVKALLDAWGIAELNARLGYTS
jgi:hypothetical protein